MNQNRKIKQIKEDNYYTPPVNIEPFVNPFNPKWCHHRFSWKF